MKGSGVRVPASAPLPQARIGGDSGWGVPNPRLRDASPPATAAGLRPDRTAGALRLGLDRRLLSVCLDLDPLWPWLLGLRDANLEHAVLEGRGDVVLRDSRRKADRARERAVAAFEPPE